MVGITSSVGLGSGLDIRGIVEQVVAAESDPGLNRVNRREARIQARLSALGTFKGALSGFQGSLSAVKGQLDFNAHTAVSSDDSVVTVSAAKGATAGKYVLNVTQLSAAHALTTDSTLTNAQFASTSDQLGTGTLTFKFGTTAYDAQTDTYTSFNQNPDKGTQTVTVSDGSLEGVRDAINDANIGVSASIIYDGSYYRLAINGKDGAASSMEVSVADDDGNGTDAAGLSLLAFNNTATNMQQTVAAQDAQLTLNGVAISNPSNALSKTVSGLTMDLQSLGTAVVDVSANVSEPQSAIVKFVKGYNDLIKTMNDLTAYDPETRRAGALQGEISLLTVRSQIRQTFSRPIVGQEDSPYHILADIGIKLNSSDGTMEIDNAKLEEALRTNPQAVAALFGEQGQSTDPLISYSSAKANTVEGRYDINVSQLATQGDYTGSAAANLTITSGTNDTFNFLVDGISAAVSLTPGTYTAAALVTELQTQINGVTAFSEAGKSVVVSETAGVFSVMSMSYGSLSAVDVTGGNGKVGLFGASAVATPGIDAAGSIGSTAATAEGQSLTGTGAAEGLQLSVTGGAVGSRGTLTLSRGYAERLDIILDRMLNSNGTLESINQGIDSQLGRIGDDRTRLLRQRSSLQARLTKQFVALDALVGRLRSTSNSLASQLASLPKIGG